MQDLIQRTQQSAEVKKFIEALETHDALMIEGLWDSPKAILTHAAFRQRDQFVLFLTRGTTQSDPIYDDLINFVPERVLLFPSWETLPHEPIKPHPEIVGDRFNILRKLIRARETGDKYILILDIQSLMQKMLPPDKFSSMLLKVSVGDSIALDDLLKKAITAGYDRESMIEEKGQFSHRGGIFDIFPITEDYPVRIEFFGDEVESIRRFDPATQKSTERLNSVLIAPFDEMALYEKYGRQLTSIISYLPQDTLVFYDSPHEIETRAADIEEQIPEHSHHYFRMAELDSLLLAKKRVYFEDLAILGTKQIPGTRLGLEILSADRLPGAHAITIEDGKTRLEVFKSMSGWLDHGCDIYFVCNNTGELDRLKMIFEENKIEITPQMHFAIGSLNSGYYLPDIKLLVVCDREIFHRYKIRRKVRHFKGAMPIYDFSELHYGDYVVHSQYGIGIYRGLTRLTGKDPNREFIAIEYQEQAKLYVPIAQANLISKYIGADRSRPHIDVLGGKRWSHVKRKTEKAIEDYASDLLELYAVRQSLKGTAFSTDTLWQKEFEDAFIYEETPDQIKTIELIKSDLEQPRPMDRLICGDVGYGKTEVAIRAAFKTVMEGKQVAVLVPTTVLAQQHFHTFSERMADYPIRIEMLSRFRTGAQQKKIIAGLNQGTIDVIIGTHRLVQKDVAFKDLGLVIVDEEQRFGVRHKEQLKQLRRLVDVLTMTATPIPRTLYLSLVGARDMSNIDTPPMDRLPVKTIMAQYDPQRIRDIINRELNRDGQVFFLHNRVKTIDRKKDHLQRLVPDATIMTAHGQMHERELESIMEKFIEGKIGVLVCTTIIESGLDIPNANTIIIDNAHKFGLADLYQLRGRVGRWKHQAYAYLLVPRDREIIEIAKRRLKAIIDSQGYGAGFKIAMRDLEIRGAGNILGTEQHGHIAAVGFHLYCNLLKRAIERLKGHEVPQYQATILKIKVDAYIPNTYIPDARQRIDIYRRLGDIVSVDQLKEIRAELKDRYGEMPSELINLLQVIDLKLWAQRHGITSIELSDTKLIAICRGRRLTKDGKFPRISAEEPKEMFLDIKAKLEKLIIPK